MVLLQLQLKALEQQEVTQQDTRLAVVVQAVQVVAPLQTIQDLTVAMVLKVMWHCISNVGSHRQANSNCRWCNNA